MGLGIHFCFSYCSEPASVMVNVPSKAIAGETVKLDATPTRDSPTDKEYLTVVWDIEW